MTTSTNLAAQQTNETDLVITRLFDAPRDLVFKVWTDPTHLKQWMGPRDHPAVHFELDLRPGGAWRACLRPVAGGADLWQGGSFREIVPHERLVYTFAWDEAHPAHGHETLITITFAEEHGKTRMLFRQMFLPSVAERDGHRGGWSSSFDRLDELLKAEQQLESDAHKEPKLTAEGAREIVMTRHFDAPPALVFDATTKSEHVRRWFVCGDELTMPVCEIDLRVGGGFRYVMRKSDGMEFTMSGVYREISRPERIVHTERFNDDAGAETVVTVTLTPKGDGTLLRTHILHKTAEGRDAHLAGMRQGVAPAFARLDAILQNLRS